MQSFWPWHSFRLHVNDWQTADNELMCSSVLILLISPRLGARLDHFPLTVEIRIPLNSILWAECLSAWMERLVIFVWQALISWGPVSVANLDARSPLFASCPAKETHDSLAFVWINDFGGSLCANTVQSRFLFHAFASGGEMVWCYRKLQWQSISVKARALTWQ